MNAIRNKNRRARRAFTLLEILLVVGLLALLAAFVVPSLVGQADKAKIDLARTAVGPNGPLAGAIDLYKVNVGSWPTDLKYLYEKPPEEELAKNWVKGIKDLSGLKDPWGRDYMYRQPGEKNKDGVDLWSMGPDGIDGNEDDVVNWERDTN